MLALYLLALYLLALYLLALYLLALLVSKPLYLFKSFVFSLAEISSSPTYQLANFTAFRLPISTFQLFYVTAPQLLRLRTESLLGFVRPLDYTIKLVMPAKSRNLQSCIVQSANPIS